MLVTLVEGVEILKLDGVGALSAHVLPTLVQCIVPYCRTRRSRRIGRFRPAAASRARHPLPARCQPLARPISLQNSSSDDCLSRTQSSFRHLPPTPSPPIHSFLSLVPTLIVTPYQLVSYLVKNVGRQRHAHEAYSGRGAPHSRNGSKAQGWVGASSESNPLTPQRIQQPAEPAHPPPSITARISRPQARGRGAPHRFVAVTHAQGSASTHPSPLAGAAEPASRLQRCAIPAHRYASANPPATLVDNDTAPAPQPDQLCRYQGHCRAHVWSQIRHAGARAPRVAVDMGRGLAACRVVDQGGREPVHRRRASYAGRRPVVPYHADTHPRPSDRPPYPVARYRHRARAAARRDAPAAVERRRGGDWQYGPGWWCACHWTVECWRGAEGGGCEDEVGAMG